MRISVTNRVRRQEAQSVEAKIPYRTRTWGDARRASAFTLTEILVCVTILALLAAVLFTAIPGAIAAGRASVTTSHLRELQMANVAWASDHDGQYVPLYTGPGFLEGSPWPINQDFAANYLGTNDAQWLSTSYPAVAKSGFPANPVGQPGLATIGYNMTDWANWGATQFSPASGSTYSFRVAEVRNPSQLMAFADSTDWLVGYGSRAAWVPSDDSGRVTANCVAYRYHGKCIAVAYDGSTFMFSVADSNNPNIWVNDPSK